MATRLDYDKAILLSQARLQVPDPLLRAGHVEMTRAGKAWGNQGGFAVVYKFNTSKGHRALRCFTRPMKPDTRQRYELMGPYFRQHAKDVTAEFTYYDQGIEVEEMVQGQLQRKTYPIIDMEWIDGTTLFDQVEKLCKQRAQAALQELANRWIEVVQKLRKADMAHGDLAAVNVMVCHDNRLVLIDYDGVYIKALAGKQQLLFGTRGFQHPQMEQRPFDEWMDEFSALVIYTALLALQAQPTLWDTYTKYDSTTGRALDQTLLFTHDDFEAPQYSALFRDLESSPNARVRQAIKELKQACLLPVAQMRFPQSLPDPDYDKKQALEALKQAIANNDDEQIVRAWGTVLEQYPAAQPHRPALQRASMRVQALERFRQALQSRSLPQVLSSYDPGLLNPCKNVTAAEREQLRLAQQLAAAFVSDKDDQLLRAWKNIEQSPYPGFVTLPVTQQQRLGEAQRRQALIDRFRAALASKSIEQIATAYDSALDAFSDITHEQRQILVRARAFRKACLDNDDEAVEGIAAEIQGNPIFSQALVFSQAEQARIQLVLRCKTALEKFQQGLQTRNARQIVASYDSQALDTYKKVTTEERQKLRLAQEWEEAYRHNQDKRIIAAWDAIQRGPYQGFLIFTQADADRVSCAQRRTTALDLFRQTLQSRRVQPIVQTYETHRALLDQHPDITAAERVVLGHAQRFSQACQDNDDLAIEDTAQKIKNAPALNQTLSFTPPEEDRIHLAARRKAALLGFRAALKNRLAQEIEASYDATLLGLCKNVTQADRDQFEAARRFLQMRRAVLAALQVSDVKQAAASYDEQLAAQFDDFTPQEQQQIDAARHWRQLEQALTTNDYLTAIQTAQAIEQVTGKPVSDIRLRAAKRQFIGTVYPQRVEVHRLGTHVQVQWDWPASDLVEAAAIAWRFDRFPRTPFDVHPETKPANPYHCYRKPGETQGAYMLNVGYAQQVYVQVFSAMSDWDQVFMQQHWYYSNGLEETTQRIA